MDQNQSAEGANRSRRSFLSATAGIGAAAAVTFGQNALGLAADAVKSQAKLDVASAVTQQIAFPGSQAEFKAAFDAIQVHENDHVAFLVKALGSAARPKPTFKNLEQNDVHSFITLATAFENVGAGAYTFAAYYINNKAYLDSAAQIALVEGRHAGFLNVATGKPITINNLSFEQEDSAGYVGQQVAPFLADLNGGPPLSYGLFSTPKNDIAILNFALALEYLEAEFYNINVPKFY